jgi:DNA-directed RNA polymerase subunit H
MKKRIYLSKHELVPKHVKVGEKEKKTLLEKYQITPKELPKIIKGNPALHDLGAEIGDIIKIIRKSPTAGESVYYRVVTNA